jgi:hypothetical protein
MDAETRIKNMRVKLLALRDEIEVSRGGEPPDVKGVELRAFWRQREVIFEDVLKAVKLIADYLDLLEDVETDISERSGCK